MDFSKRVERLPTLGLGLSTEFGAGRSPGALDPLVLRDQEPAFASFLEVGVEAAKGLDPQTRAWAQAGHPTTYHFLDVNLDEPEDLDPDWLDEVRHLATILRPAWLCGDAGLWHFGPRDRNHMLLLPPVLSEASAREIARGVVALREATGLEVLPENPPGSVFLGDLHLAEFMGCLAREADTGLLVDVAHLAIHQRLRGLRPLEGLEALPLDRVVEVHVAGGRERDHQGLAWVEDDHGVDVLDDTWTLLEWLLPRAPNLRAVVFECERNPIPDTLPGFRRIHALLAEAPLGQRLDRSGRP